MDGETVLPVGWVRCTIGEVFHLKNGFAFKSTIYSNKGYPLIRISNIKEGGVEIDEEVCVPSENAKLDFLIQNGDLLIALSGATTGKWGVFTSSRKCLLNQRVGNLQIISLNSLSPNYRNYYIASIRKEIELSAYGGAQPNISPTELSKIGFPLPPLNEQKRIVAKLDSIMPRIDSVKERLEKIPVILKRFRQSVLTAAVTGKLTEKWREENPDVENTFTENDVEYSELPEKWKKIEFHLIIKELKNGIPLKPNISPPGTKILRISANRSGDVNLDDYRFIPGDVKKYSNFLLKDGDLLFTRYNGNIDLVGVCGKVRNLVENFLYPDKLMRVRINENLSDSDFIEFIFQTGSIRDFLESKSKSSAGQNGLSGSDLKQTPIPLPPLEEQKEIVRQVDKLFALADKVEDHYKKAKLRVDKLSQSVLAKAFRGELVPQDPNDEPAEKLLERILEEKKRLEDNVKLPSVSSKKKIVKKKFGK